MAKNNTTDDYSRRRFLRTAGLAAAAGTLLPWAGCSDSPVDADEQ